MNATSRLSAPEKLRSLVSDGKAHLAPACFDALSARLVERAGFCSVLSVDSDPECVAHMRARVLGYCAV